MDQAVRHRQNDGAAGGFQQPLPDFGTLLVRVGRDKDRAAFEALYDHYAPRVKSFLMKGGAAPDAADELAQETFVTVWQRAGSYDPLRASAATWIFTIARNKRIDALRRVRPSVELDETMPIATDTADAGEILSAEEETDIMARAIERLPSEQADLLYKSFFEDKSHADIAKESGLPLGTVKSRIRLALEKLGGNSKVKELWP